MAEYIWQKRRILYPVFVAVFLFTVSLVTWYHVQPAEAAVPTTPSVTVSGNSFNPTLTTSAFSGSPAHSDTDFKIVTTADCAAGTAVWSATNQGAIETVEVDHRTGSFSGALSGFDALAYDTTYYACALHTNADGDSGWSTPQSFTTANLDDHLLKRQLTVANTTATAKTGYEVRLLLTSSNYDFADADPEGDDIRFTDSTEAIALPYWVEFYDSAAQEAVVWVRVPDLPANPSTETIYIYYGAQASSEANGFAVFHFFEDFENGVGGFTTPNGGTLTTTSTYAQQGSNAAQMTYNGSGTNRDARYDFGSGLAEGEYVMETYARWDKTGGNFGTIEFAESPKALSTDSVIQMWFSDDSGDRIYYRNSNSSVNAGNYTLYNFYKFIYYPRPGGQFVGYVFNDGDVSDTPFLDTGLKTTDSSTGTSNMRYISFRSRNADFIFDSVFVRKTVTSDIDNEPGVTYGAKTVVGSAPSAPTISTVNGNLYAPTITTGAFSGAGLHSTSDYKIVETNDCSAGTIVWQVSDSDLLLSAKAKATLGTWTGSISGLAENTTYYACARHANGAGDSSWSSPVSFTTPNDLVNGQTYWHEIRVTNQTGTSKSQYQVRLQLDTNDIDFANIDSQGRDIRFTDSTQTYYLPYWIEAFDSVGETATIWVVVPSLPDWDSYASIYMYYGSGSTTTREDEDALFEVWEGFEDGTIGDFENVSLDTIQADNTNAQHGTYAGSFYEASNSSSQYAKWDMGTYAEGEYALEFYQKIANTSNNRFGQVTWGESPTQEAFDSLASVYMTGDKFYYFSGNSGTNSGVNHGTNTYRKTILYSIAGGTYRGYVYSDADVTAAALVDTGVRTVYNNTGTFSPRYIEVRIDTNTVHLDSIFIRKAVGSNLDEEPVSSVQFQRTNGTPPNTPSVSSVSGLEYLPTITSGAYSGSFSHEGSEYKIVSTNNCASGTLVWSSDTYEYKTSILVNQRTGTWANSGQRGLEEDTTYYACVRHLDSAGYSSWSSPSSFTTAADLTSNGGFSNQITIANQSGSAYTDYAVRINLDANDIDFADPEAQGRDFRVVDSTKTYAIPHWLEEFDTVAETATIWVLMPSVPASPSTVNIHLYYGSGSTTSQATPETVFDFFEGFEDGSVADVTNNNLDSITADTTLVQQGTYSLKLTENSTNYHWAKYPLDRIYREGQYAVEYHIADSGSFFQPNIGVAQYDDGNTAIGAMYFQTTGTIYYLSNASGFDTGVTNNVDDYYKMIQYHVAGGDYRPYAYNNANTDQVAVSDPGEVLLYSPNGNSDIHEIGFRVRSGSGYIDSIIIRRTEATNLAGEPTTTAGTTQTYITPPSTPSVSSYTNNTITASTFSGGGVHDSTDWRIITGNDCTISGNIHWEAIDTTTNLETVKIDTSTGTFKNDWNGFLAPPPNVPVKACVRYTNGGGDSSWSTAFSLTTEDPTAVYDHVSAITLTNNTGSELTDYQVLLKLTSSNFDFSNLQSDGDDIRFTDASLAETYPYWIEYIDHASNKLALWVKVDSIPASGAKELFMFHNDATVGGNWYNPEGVFVEFNGFEDGNATEFTNVDLTSISTTNTDQFSGTYAAQFNRASGTGGGVDAYMQYAGAPYAAGSYAYEFMYKTDGTNNYDHIWLGDENIPSSSGYFGLSYWNNGTFYARGNAGSNALGVNYSADTYYKHVHYLNGPTDYDSYVYSDLTANPIVSDTGRNTDGQSVDTVDYLDIHRVDPTNGYMDNIIVRKAAGNATDEPSQSTGPASTTAAPLFVSVNTPTQANDGSGNISVDIEVTEFQADESRIKVEYSDDGGSTWKDPELSGATPNSGAVDLDNNNAFQIGTVNGIDTDENANVVVTATWDSNNAANNGGAGGITDYQTDILLRMTLSDGTNESAQYITPQFIVDNAAPTGLGSFTSPAQGFYSTQLSWTPVSDDNNASYRICYSTVQSQAQNCTGSTWDNNDDANLSNKGTGVTTVQGLTQATTYYFKIFATDAFGNEATVADISQSTQDISGWLTNQQVKIDNTGNSAHTNFQVRFTLTETLGMDSNCNDIRIVGFDGASNLPHWVETCDVAGNNVTVWTEIPSISSNTSDEIFFYYNNPSLDVNAEDPEDTFLDFFDENNTTGGISGDLAGAYDSVGASGDYFRFNKTTGNSIDDYSITLNPEVNAEQDVSMHLAFEIYDQSGGNDQMRISVADIDDPGSNSYDSQYSYLRLPDSAQTGMMANTALTGSFNWQTYYKMQQDIIRSGDPDTVDTYWNDANGGAIDSNIGDSVYSGTPDSMDLVNFHTHNSGLRTDFRLDYLFFTKLSPEAPTVTIGDAPTQPSITAPANTATDISINPTVTASTPTNGTSIYADWQVSDDGTFSDSDCSDTNIVWCKLSSTDDISSITVDAASGTFQNARNGYTALDQDTQYWVRTRTKNAGGWSPWSSANSFTTVADAAPVASNVSIDSGAASVALTANTTKNVVVTATATDDGGCSTITGAELKLYRTDLGNGQADDANSMYTVSCTEDVGSCTGGPDTTSTFTCTAAVEYYADATDAGSVNAGTNWTAQVIASDTNPGPAGTDTIEMGTLTALNVSEASIAFGSLGLNQDTGATNQTTTVVNTGNENIDVTVHGYGSTPGDGYAMTCDSGSIPVDRIKYKALTTFTYGTGGTQLSSSATEVDLDIPQRTSTETNKLMRWGLRIPPNGAGASCSGTIVFGAVSDPNVD